MSAPVNEVRGVMDARRGGSPCMVFVGFDAATVKMWDTRDTYPIVLTIDQARHIARSLYRAARHAERLTMGEGK